MILPNYQYQVTTRKNFQIKGELTIEGAKEKLWQIITSPGHLEKFHPFVKEHIKTEKWHGIGAKDSGSFYSGKKINRVVTEWKEGSSYIIKMKNDDGSNTTVRFGLTELSSMKTAFFITIQTDAYRKIPRPFWPIFARFFLVPSFKKYLYSILNGLAYYSTTGNKIKKNQFGRHRKFSP